MKRVILLPIFLVLKHRAQDAKTPRNRFLSRPIIASFLICTSGISQSSWLDYSWAHWAMSIVEHVKTQNTGHGMPQTPRDRFLSKLSNWALSKILNTQNTGHRMPQTPRNHFSSKLSNRALSKMSFADNEEDLRQPCISDPWPCVYWEVSFKFETRTASSLFDDDFTWLEHI